MLTTGEATDAIRGAMPHFEAESVAVQEAVGSILRQDAFAERDQPPFDRVTMDGIALAHAAYADGRRQFAIQGTQHAGDAVLELTSNDHCIEAMTGAVLPRGCNCVIPVERLQVSDATATIDADYEAGAGQFIHPRGSDHRKGTQVLRNGEKVSPMDVAIAASCGLAQLQVAQTPAIRIVSTGNELVKAGMPIAAHQIRLSNGPALEAMFAEQCFRDVRHEHLPDDISTLEKELAGMLTAARVLVLSGGVSMGKADYVPQVLKSLGVEMIFHKIRQRPGKPMWFGIGKAGQAVFALPGNPVSSLVCARQYVLPALLQASGRVEQASRYAELAEDVEFKPDLTCFLPVRISHAECGKTLAVPVPTNTSGDFAALGGTDGYVELLREESRFAAGTAVPYHAWDSP